MLPTTNKSFIPMIVFTFHVTAHEIFIPQQLEKQRAAGWRGGLKRHFTLQLDAFVWCTASGRLAGRQAGDACSTVSPLTPHPVSTHFNNFTFLTKSGKIPFQEILPASPQRAAQINAEPLCTGPHVNEAQFTGYAQRKGGNRCGSWRLDSRRGPVAVRRSAPDIDSAPLGNATADYRAYTSQQ